MTNWGRANSVLAIFCVIITHTRITHGHTHRLWSEQHVAFTNLASWYNSLPTGKKRREAADCKPSYPRRPISAFTVAIHQHPANWELQWGGMSDTTSTLHWSSNNFDLAAVISSFYCLDTFLTNSSQAGNIEILFGAVGAEFTVSWAEFIPPSLSFVESSLMFALTRFA